MKQINKKQTTIFHSKMDKTALNFLIFKHQSKTQSLLKKEKKKLTVQGYDNHFFTKNIKIKI